MTSVTGTGDRITPGIFSITAVPVGVLPIPGWEAYFGVNDIEFHDLVFYVWIVSDGETTALIDLGLPLSEADRQALNAGCRAVDPRCEFGDVRTLDEVLDAYGIAPEDIDVAILTQTIVYHSGGLEAALLPNARVYLSQAGLLEMLLDPPGHPWVDLYFTESSWSFLRRLAIERRLNVTDGPIEIVPGLVFETTGGHHPGSAAVRIATADGQVTLLETAFFDRNIDEGIPIGIAENAAQARDAIARAVARGDRVVAVHDPKNASRFAASAPRS